MDMAERIKELRERRSYGQAELARAAGISPNALWRIESGMHAPRPVTVRKIAAALGVDVEVLTGKATSNGKAVAE